MKSTRPSGAAASARQRLLNLAHQQHLDFQDVLRRYAIERLLYRLSQSEYANQFILKGAMLFTLWSGTPQRATQDLDLLGSGESSIAHFEEIFRRLCQLELEEPDGLEWQPDLLKIQQMREEEHYQGLRVHLVARLAVARIAVQIDIGFGDAVTPGPVVISFPTLLRFPAPQVRSYPRETVVAEKFQVMVALELVNSRIKDFYDLWVLARHFEFDGPTLCRALKATFERRRTPLPTAPPVAFTSAFAQDREKQRLWLAFLRKNQLESGEVMLSDVLALLEQFLLPPAAAQALGQPFTLHWPVGGPWQALEETNAGQEPKED
jgi:predicted nucleotidyltransferase component of viral defense system